MKAKNVLLIAVFAAFFAGVLVGSMGVRTGNMITGSLENIPQLSTEGFSKADVDAGPYLIYLTSGCYRLSMITNEVQSDSIEKGLLNVTDIRPTTHDMINQIMINYDIHPIMVKIESFRDGTYYSKILMRQGNNILNLDSRPSDAIGVAVRSGTPVYVKNSLLEEVGEKIC
jgi:bifunctional DNase/RNase